MQHIKRNFYNSFSSFVLINMTSFFSLKCRTLEAQPQFRRRLARSGADLMHEPMQDLARHQRMERKPGEQQRQWNQCRCQNHRCFHGAPKRAQKLWWRALPELQSSPLYRPIARRIVQPSARMIARQPQTLEQEEQQQRRQTCLRKTPCRCQMMGERQNRRIRLPERQNRQIHHYLLERRKRMKRQPKLELGRRALKQLRFSTP